MAYRISANSHGIPPSPVSGFKMWSSFAKDDSMPEMRLTHLIEFAFV